MNTLILIMILFCCKLCNCVNTIVAIGGFIITFLSLKISCESLNQTKKAREDIAYNQVALMQNEIIKKIVNNLNKRQMYVEFIFEQNGGHQKKDVYKCNLFELKQILINERSNKFGYKNLPIYYSVDTQSLISIESYKEDGFIDSEIAKALSLFDFLESKSNRIEVTSVECPYVEIEVIEKRNHSNKHGFLQNINNRNVKYTQNLIESISALEDALKNWFKKKGINDFNLYVNPKNLKPILSNNK